MNVSIAIPTFNRPELLLAAIESCLAQTRKPYEILIGDDSNNELSEKLVARIFAGNTAAIKINYHHNKPGLGQNDNVDMLIKKASGDKFLLLHDDDTLLPNALELMAKPFETHSDIHLVIGKQYITTHDGEVLTERTERDMASYFKTADYEGSVLTSLDSAIMQQIPMNGFLVNMDYVKNIGYPKKIGVGNACDFAFGINLANAGAKFYFLNEYVSTYRLSHDSINRSTKDDWGYRSFRILEALPYPADKPVDYRKIRLSNISPRALRQAILFNKPREAMRILLGEPYRSHLFSPGTVKSLLMLLRGLIIKYK
ncbi:glycosyltransferase family 2 protein [Parapedobacter deserti]|uniref:Glycosyltransferase family 2 protein n=1 Tax=Parapedobacter deserti TaxID=1912957 RepID=A0ABV7JUI8_9SPHI